MSTLFDDAVALLGLIWLNLGQEDKEWFLEAEPYEMHNDLGRHLRNHCGMWEVPHVPVIVDGVDMAVDHPDAISHRAIVHFQQLKQLGL
ncbi:hypothetical protein pf16_07 [Pseudomonas phage pf16]|uniref:Uncharacterized protein n=1 Tax=Pseudomonas phage pf16 TaxID=1815630 RepID=A0A1S5R5X5_9CAUD|nr:hypothetical protein FDG98_gp006 [Pseudomonas phage pf16]AND74930.1 hypothetical protein pf16_07 [Pseudomonas phage pf16]